MCRERIACVQSQHPSSRRQSRNLHPHPVLHQVLLPWRWQHMEVQQTQGVQDLLWMQQWGTCMAPVPGRKKKCINCEVTQYSRNEVQKEKRNYEEKKKTREGEKESQQNQNPTYSAPLITWEETLNINISVTHAHYKNLEKQITLRESWTKY